MGRFKNLGAGSFTILEDKTSLSVFGVTDIPGLPTVVSPVYSRTGVRVTGPVVYEEDLPCRDESRSLPFGPWSVRSVTILYGLYG